MRLYIDTNILVFALFDPDKLSKEVKAMISDYSNILFTSTVCIDELIHLCQIGKIAYGGKKDFIKAESMIPRVEDAGIDIIPISKRHLQQVATLPLYEDHRDPNDRLIIAQAISDKIPLISSDHKFKLYIPHGLNFIFNKR